MLTLVNLPDWVKNPEAVEIALECMKSIREDVGPFEPHLNSIKITLDNIFTGLEKKPAEEPEILDNDVLLGIAMEARQQMLIGNDGNENLFGKCKETSILVANLARNFVKYPSLKGFDFEIVYGTLNGVAHWWTEVVGWSTIVDATAMDFEEFKNHEEGTVGIIDDLKNDGMVYVRGERVSIGSKWIAEDVENELAVRIDDLENELESSFDEDDHGPEVEYKRMQLQVMEQMINDVQDQEWVLESTRRALEDSVTERGNEILADRVNDAVDERVVEILTEVVSHQDISDGARLVSLELNDAGMNLLNDIITTERHFKIQWLLGELQAGVYHALGGKRPSDDAEVLQVVKTVIENYMSSQLVRA
jgi:hypothetical protein